MNIISCTPVNTTLYGYPQHGCVYAIIVEVAAVNAQQEAADILKMVTDTSWTNSFDAIDKASLLACAQPTIEKIVNSILHNVGNTIEKEFGEYLVSYSAKRALVSQLSHIDIPLSELFKEKISGNPGFDFHTKSHNSLIVFGEAKYKSTHSAYKDAEDQLIDFLKMEPEKQKHIKELKELRKFTGNQAAGKVLDGKFGVAAAFSTYSQNADMVIKHAIEYDSFQQLLNNEEVYIIGVHIV